MGTSLSAKFADEIGFKALTAAPRDVKIILLSRIARFLAYGSTTLILALYLHSLGFNDQKIGLFMTLTLLGDVVMSLILTLIADTIGRRRMLAFGALLMVASGIVFALSKNYWILVLASVFGVISPSGSEIGPFRAIEESTIVHLVSYVDRTSILAWYTVFGFAGSSFGIVICGWAVRHLQASFGYSPLASYRTIFWAYSILGFVKFLLSLLLTTSCEPTAKPDLHPVHIEEDETQSLLANDQARQPKALPGGSVPKSGSIWKSLLPSLSPESAAILVKICILFALDSLGSGLASASWLTYFFNQKFNLSEGKLGTIFFVASILSSMSNLVASPLAKRIGLIKTMVFTHVPASVALTLIPLPNNIVPAIGLLVFRATTSSMDQAPRQAFLAAAVLPDERTAVMGMVNVTKTLAQSVSPFVTGALAQKSKFWEAFVLAGVLKLIYDALILGLFLGYRTVEERAEARLDNGDTAGDTGTG